MKTTEFTQYADSLEDQEEWDVVPHCTQAIAEEIDPDGSQREAGLLIADM